MFKQSLVCIETGDVIWIYTLKHLGLKQPVYWNAIEHAIHSQQYDKSPSIEVSSAKTKSGFGQAEWPNMSLFNEVYIWPVMTFSTSIEPFFNLEKTHMKMNS